MAIQEAPRELELIWKSKLIPRASIFLNVHRLAIVEPLLSEIDVLTHKPVAS